MQQREVSNTDEWSGRAITPTAGSRSSSEANQGKLKTRANLFSLEICPLCLFVLLNSISLLQPHFLHLRKFFDDCFIGSY